jgi:hypothetical protein
MPLAEPMDNVLRRIIPRKVLTLLRFYLVYNRELGHSRRIDGIPCDGRGEPLPWMTYPLIEFLRTLDLSDCHVFEFGAGSSTLFWAQRTATVTSVEKNEAWFRRLQAGRPANCKLIWCPHDCDYIAALAQQEQLFDVIVVDGAVRYPCAEAAIEHVTEQGLILLDNTEWYPQTAKRISAAGFTQIDFSGFGPINAFTSTTSLFFRDPQLLQRRAIPPGWAPAGGRYLDAYDDQPFNRIDPRLID